MRGLRWDADMPAEVRAAVQPHLDKWTGLLPTWCQEFRVKWDSDERDGLASMTAHYDNRWATLRIAPAWLEQDEDHREVTIIHELIHVAIAPLHDAARCAVDDMVEANTALHNIASRTVTEGMEQSVEDLARAIRRVAGR